MSMLSNIPFAIFQNIGFTALLFLVYQGFKLLEEKEIIYLKASTLFLMAILLQSISVIQFSVILFFPQWSSQLLTEGFNFLTTSLRSLNYHSTIDWFFLVGVLYVFVVLILILKFIFQFYHLSVLVKNTDFSVSETYKACIYNVSKNATSKKLKLGISSTLYSPISFGWIEPIILLPIALVNQLTIKELESIILHEWAHIQRNDYFINTIVTLIQLVLFFNPFTYLFNKEISLQREIACDYFVIATSKDKLSYLNALYKIANSISHKNNYNLSAIPWSMGILNYPNELLYRVKTLTTTNRFNRAYFSKLIFSSSLALLLFFIPFQKPPLLKSSTIKVKQQLPISYVTKVNSNRIQAPQPTHIYSAIHKHKHLLEKHNHQNTAMLEMNELERNGNLLNVSYDEMVAKTLGWIKTREIQTQWASYQEDEEAAEMEVAEKLLMKAIYSNYQLKREILNDLLSKAEDEKEAMDYILNSKQWQQMQQFQKWTAEFLKKHPYKYDSIFNRTIVY